MSDTNAQKVIDDIAMQCPFHSGVVVGDGDGHVTVDERNKITNFGDEIAPHLYNLRDRLTVDDIRKSEVTYANYINTEKLLSLQGSDIKKGLHHHDEHLFILVHQGFELWFKQILHELTSIRNIIMSECERGGVIGQEAAHVCVSRLQRCDQIMRHSLGIFDILETMHPADFLEFRDYIGPASGFQSVQMRELEILIGLEDHERVRCGFHPYTEPLQKDEVGLKKIEQRKREPSIKNVVYKWLDKIYDRVPNNFLSVFLEKKRENVHFQKSLWLNDSERIEAAVEKELSDLRPFFEGEEMTSNQNEEGLKSQETIRRRRIATLFIMCYRQNPEITLYDNLLDSLVGFEEAMILWRSRHARMVERMIGRRLGTGGSSGVAYLDMTTSYRVFLDLWQTRSHFIRATALPKMSLKGN